MNNGKTFDEVMNLTRTVSSHTAFEDAECRALYDLCMSVPPNGTVVEIGCQIGRSSSIILQCAPARGYHPIFIDPWTVQPDYMRQWMAMAHALDIPFTCHMMRSAQAAQLPTFIWNRIDLLLIDGDHTLAGVAADTCMAELVRYNGVLCAHDYGRDSLPDVYEVMSKYAVQPAWDEIGIYGTLGVWKRL